MRGLKRFLVGAIGLLLLGALPLAVSQGAREAALRLSAPIGRLAAGRSAALRSTLLNLRSLGALQDERSVLQLQVAELRIQLQEQERLREENGSLRAELGVSGGTRELPKVLGRIVLRGGDPLDGTAILDVGMADGIRAGQPATYRGYLVGRIISAGPRTSVVRSVTSRLSLLQARLVSGRSKGLLAGTGSGSELRGLPQGADVPPDAPVETSGLCGGDDCLIPQGVLIGAAGTKLTADSGTAAAFSVIGGADLKDADAVTVLLAASR